MIFYKPLVTFCFFLDLELKIFSEPIQSGAVERKMNYDCSHSCLELMTNSHCDAQCNTLECLWDGGDCDQVKPANFTDHRASYFQKLDFVDALFELKVTRQEKRFKLPHKPIMINRIIMSDLVRAFKPYYQLTSRFQRSQ